MRFEVLPGLPPYGPTALSFSENGSNEFREGFVVRFYPNSSEPWVGNFFGGIGSCNAVLDHPNETDIIVVAQGQGHVIDPESRTLRNRFGGDIEEVIPLSNPKAIVFRSWYDFEAIGASGQLWRSPCISTDGIRNIVFSGTELRGEAYTYFNDSWHPFTLDLLTGQCTVETYQRDTSTIARIKSSLFRWIKGLINAFGQRNANRQ